MLILGRKCEETIVINDDIEVTVLEIRGGQVKLGIRAPRSIPVHRAEVQWAASSTEIRDTSESDTIQKPLPTWEIHEALFHAECA